MRATRRTTILALALGTALLGAPLAAAAESDRAEKWQFSFPITFTSSANYDGDEGTNIDISDDVGFGIGFGYHLQEKILLGVDFTWLDANYNAHIAQDFDGDQVADDSIDVSGTLDATNLQFYGQFNFLAKRITPFVRGGFGWSWVDSNIPTGPAEGVCWWDPWWGYICDTWQPTKDETAFSYGLGAGVRAEIAERFFAEASYNILWIDFDKAGNQDFDGFRLNLGWMF